MGTPAVVRCEWCDRARRQSFEGWPRKKVDYKQCPYCKGRQRFAIPYTELFKHKMIDRVYRKSDGTLIPYKICEFVRSKFFRASPNISGEFQ